MWQEPASGAGSIRRTARRRQRARRSSRAAAARTHRRADEPAPRRAVQPERRRRATACSAARSSATSRRWSARPCTARSTATVTAIVDGPARRRHARRGRRDRRPTRSRTLDVFELPITETETMRRSRARPASSAWAARRSRRPSSCVRPNDMPIDTVILNGCECEPYLTVRPPAHARGARSASSRGAADHRRRRRRRAHRHRRRGQQARRRRGARARQRATDVEVRRAADPLPAGRREAAHLRRARPGGAARQAARARRARSCTTSAPPRRSPRRSTQRKPLMERVVTVTGRRRQARQLPARSSARRSPTCVEIAGGLDRGRRARDRGRPDDRAARSASLDVPVVKGTSGVVALDRGEAAPAVDGDQPCIRCGRCVEACPMCLQPYAIGELRGPRAIWDDVRALLTRWTASSAAAALRLPDAPSARPAHQRSARRTLMAKGVKP